MVRFKRSPSGPGRVVDRRGSGGLVKAGAGGGVALIVALLITFLGGGNSDLGGLVDALAPPSQAAEAPLDPATDPDADQVGFLGDVLGDAQAMWVGIFSDSDLEYRPTNLVIFSGATQSGCGGAYAQSGPHYCPLDEQVYMDIDFLRQLQERFGAAGDTAQAYIVAHEVAHHIQNLLGVLGQVQEIRQSDPDRGNEASISLELQADCFAGVWLHTLQNGTSAAVLEDGDLEEALNAAAAVGDDNIQKETTGRIDPESWTHGTSEQRLEWLKRGFETGQPDACNTF